MLGNERVTLKSNQDRYQENITLRDDTIAQREGIEEETVGLREQETGLQSAIDDGQQQITDKRKLSESNAAEIDTIAKQTAEFGEVRELAGKIQRFKEEIVELEDEKGVQTGLQRDLLAQKAGIDERIATYESENEANRSGKSYFSATRISSVFPTWGFVTLPIGNSAGVVTGSTLDVTRNGEVVAKLRVRSVEANRSSADVIPDSVAEGVTVRAGDRVEPGSGSETSAQAAN